MAARKAKTEKKTTETDALVEALKFISVVDREDMGGFDGHALFAHGYVYTFDGVCAAGVQVKEQLAVCPNIKLFLAALKKCKDQITISQTPNGRVSVKSGPFSGFVPCIVPENIPFYGPDQRIAPMNDDVINAMILAASLTREGDPRIVYASVLLRANTCVGTNGHMMIEAWHGVDLPPDMVIPKKSLADMVKVKGTRSVVGFGYSNTSITFYFDDDAWFKTQLYGEPWPDLSNVLDWTVNEFVEVPEGLSGAIEAVYEHNPHRSVTMAENQVRSHPSVEEGAQFALDGVIPCAAQFNGGYLIEALKFSTHYDITSDRQKAYLYGATARALIMGIL